jgi:adenine phosphoribosyltransferase
MGQELTSRLRAAFRWRDDHTADPTGWWLDPRLLRDVVTGLATLHDERPTIVAGIVTRGAVLGALAAQHLDMGFAEIRKDRKGEGDHGSGILRRATPPDYAQRDLMLTLSRRVLRPRDRVLLVDDWIATGAQAIAAQRLIEDAEAELLGVAVIVDATTAAVRRELNVRCLLHERQL